MNDAKNPRRRGCWMLVGLAVIAGVLVLVVLVLVAVPNFITFNCKARTSEARVDLASLFTLEKAFQNDHGFYTTDLVALGYHPDFPSRYLLGFAQPGPGDVTPAERQTLEDYDESRMVTSMPAVAGSVSITRTVDGRGRLLAPGDLPEATFASRDHFRIGAVGNVDEDEVLDRWTVDDSKTFTHSSDDCTFW